MRSAHSSGDFSNTSLSHSKHQSSPPHVQSTKDRRKERSGGADPQVDMSTSGRATAHATQEDATRVGIPKGYNLEQWDPDQKPLILMGSVFDANSLCKWIYDWTVHCHGPRTPMVEIAGDMWLLLIELDGKMHRAERCLEQVQNSATCNILRLYLHRGEAIWIKFKALLKDCEGHMWKHVEPGSRSMGKAAGVDFVDSFLGRDRYLKRTERIMAEMRLWNMTFDEKCHDTCKAFGHNDSRTENSRRSKR